jgi:hypothetical protein
MWPHTITQIIVYIHIHINYKSYEEWCSTYYTEISFCGGRALAEWSLYNMKFLLVLTT